jgi:nucleotide-binding universal stress UspA family protein
MKTILVPIDFSKQSDYAFQAAARIASKAAALLIVLHVMEEPISDSYIVDGEYIPEGYENQLFTLLLLRKRKAEFNKLKETEFNKLKEVEFLKDVNTKFELKVGNPYQCIAAIILQHKVDLVVMGTKGHSKGEIMLGSVTNKVIRHAKCPVLTIHQLPNLTDYKNIVYATRTFETEAIFSRIVKTAQGLYDSTIHLVRINTPSNFLSDHEAKKILHEFAELHQMKNFTVNAYSDLTEEEGIIHFAETVDANLIALATHGRSGFVHLLSGSISKGVVNHSSRPVMTFLVEQ